ncbi:MAG: 2-oxo-hepta-3-ene-1,7-dioic acid hydratase [Gammaproteobacteria bacterium]|nr:2-oxo-hepta-3-ene-1,7-dioic acid hydratase [Gammaproteobacteria bacterium]MCP5202213.1 2-oxo-hepta-3-ene-1,7-dioic acid hydratase [Gammaproteobacteria bacterium]
MLNRDTIEELAARLDDAERERRQVGQFSLEFPAMDIDDGYAVQRAWVDMKIARGARLRGHKIGLTSRAMQRAVNITEPDYGALLEDMFYDSGAEIPARYIEPRVEVELAFVLARRLEGPGCTLFDVLNATDHVVPAVEIIDARIARIDPASGATRKVFDTIADNAADAGVVLGGRPVRPHDVDLRWASALLYKNGVIEESGVAAAVLNHPAHGVAWLANKLAPRGVALEPGQVILAGSFTAPIFVAAGDTVHVDYGPLGAVTMRFA